MEDWDNIITLLMILSCALIIGLKVLFWKLGKFRNNDPRRFTNYTSRGDGDGGEYLDTNYILETFPHIQIGLSFHSL
mgnify:CR=1 FL=1